jgi:serine/threonine-protein kinase RsbT
MSVHIVRRAEARIECEDDVVLARRKAREYAIAAGFDAFATAAVTTAASELARNVWVHARRGSVTIEHVVDEGRPGMRMDFRDEGPGIADLERALAGGNSTVKSLGLGLSGSRRLVDEFHIDTSPGRGTKIRVAKWLRR